MRNFYVFQISNFIEKSLKDSPFELFHALELIYYRLDNEETQYHLVYQLIEPFSIRDMDIFLFKTFKDNYFYTKYKSVHAMHDVYRRENTILSIHKTYLNIKTDTLYPKFLEVLKKNHSLFFCDFENKDYFWLDSICASSFLEIG